MLKQTSLCEISDFNCLSFSINETTRLSTNIGRLCRRLPCQSKIRANSINVYRGNFIPTFNMHDELPQPRHVILKIEKKNFTLF